MVGIQASQSGITLRLIHTIQRATRFVNPVEPRIEVQMLMLKAVLHGVARRNLLLMLSADNHVPLQVTSVHTRHLRHQFVVVIDAQLAIGTRIGHTRVERTTILEPVVMRYAQSPVPLARP